MTDPLIDLRSDTVTKPTPAMRKVMADAEVGDDVYGEDPNVNALQEEAAALLGMEASLFVPSGTMANQIALQAHTQPGDEVIAHPQSHLIRAESGAGAALAGVQFRTMGNPDGSLPAEEVGESIYRGDNPHYPPTGLICMENTNNFAGGTALPPERIDPVAEKARQHGVAMHLDGARVLNAAIALDLKPARLTAPFQSATLCFSKGLGAPVGSVVAGDKDFIAVCLRYRKMYGGGMRQAGVLAAAARHALEHHVERLAEDHENARRLAEGLGNTPHLKLTHGLPETNMIFFECGHPRIGMEKLVAELAARGVLIGGMGPYQARVVTHLDVDRAGIEKTIGAFQQILAA
ncbi:MAG: aminotransferase class I/II-fold pyridoxal phosphate-dependent enzyme [SAR324 cluster bacterium]|nr:aminotransferase class I/II-fold pyridoxal phosphate-dependent enzyme [SAR324 cluster bacterium]MCH8888524.1 aminotransferase class I/II-fold pyridoxal phosphate-dependent enzyme [SAR324 cluster bacterium]